MKPIEIGVRLSPTLISAVVINWNGVDYLDDCLRAIQSQDPPPAEIIVADNHSDDGSREFVAERFPEVRIVDTGDNRGPGRARNAGAEAASHDTLLFVDNDVVLRPGALAELSRVLEGDESTGMVQARSLCSDRPEVVHYDASDLHFLGTLILHNWFRPLSEVTAHAGPVGGGIGLCFVIKRAVYERVGGFHEELFFYYEDTDFAWRLRLLGYHIFVAADATVLHHGGTAGLSYRSGGEYPARRTYLHSRNRWLVLLTCLRVRTLLLTLPAQLLYAATYIAFAASRGQLFAAVRGHLAVIPALPRVWRWRRQAQRGRRVRDRDLLTAAPLSVHPGLADRGFKRRVREWLDRGFAGYWRVVRGLCG